MKKLVALALAVMMTLSLTAVSYTHLDVYKRQYNKGLNRTWNVIVQGLGLYIPVYRLVKLWKSYKRCGENVDMPWDEGVVYSVKDFGSFRGWLYALSLIHI